MLTIWCLFALPTRFSWFICIYLSLFKGNIFDLCPIFQECNYGDKDLVYLEIVYERCDIWVVVDRGEQFILNAGRFLWDCLLYHIPADWSSVYELSFCMWRMAQWYNDVMTLQLLTFRFRELILVEIMYWNTSLICKMRHFLEIDLNCCIGHACFSCITQVCEYLE